MKNINYETRDIVDIISFFKELLRNKLIIFMYLTTGIILGSFQILLTEEKFESYIRFSKKNSDIQVLDNKNINLTLIKEHFFSKKFFDIWLAENPESNIRFEDFKDVKNSLSNDFEFLRDNSELEAFFQEIDKNNTSYALVIRSNNHIKINQYSDYFEFINNIITKKKIADYVREHSLLKDLLKANKGSNLIIGGSFTSDLASVQNKVNFFESNQILKIYPPTEPEKKQPLKFITIAIYSILSILMSLFHILFLKKRPRN